ncbi:MAG: sulfatase-like hydrolase/transferase [Bacteroidota bacterium]
MKSSLWKFIAATSLVGLLVACQEEVPPVEEEMEEEEVIDDGGEVVIHGSPNILFIIADDMGLDATNGYPEGSTKPTTPHLDSIRDAGLAFTNMWVNPTCSPTRASIITGKYGHTTDVLAAGDELGAEHQTLQAYISQETGGEYATAVVGKWHLAGSNTSFNPETLGIDYYAGHIRGTANSYQEWDFTEDGVTTTETEYITKKFTDLAIDWVEEQTTPWFLWLAYTAPHTPFHLPPAGMHLQGDLPGDEASISANSEPYYMAAIEAMDFQVGELLDAIGPEQLANTYVIFLGDNGTPGRVAQNPYGRGMAKGSVYQGGINTPLFVAGPNVTPMGMDNALFNGVDLFATMASMAGASVSSVHDSRSFLSVLQGADENVRDYIYSELRADDGSTQYAIRNTSHKLIVGSEGTEELYDLSADPYETTNLLDSGLNGIEQAQKEALEAAAAEIRGE